MYVSTRILQPIQACELCSFDMMVNEFGLATPPLQRLATMVRAADTGRLDLSPILNLRTEAGAASLPGHFAALCILYASGSPLSVG
jgi:hypothetical protein